MKLKIGAAFSDSIYQHKTSFVKPKRGNYSSDEPPKTRKFLFPIILILSVIILIGRLFYLQIMKGDQYLLLSDTNRTRSAIIFAPRGIIFDRNNKPLVFNTPGFRRVFNGKTELLDAKTGIQL